MRLLVLAALFCATLAVAETPTRTHFFVIAGGGEPPGRTTMFDTSMMNLANYSRGYQFEKRVYFDGRHADAQASVQAAFGYKPASLTITNYDRQVDEYIRDLRAGRIKSGEKMMIVVNTHGSSPVRGQISHSVSADDENGQNGTVDLARLKELRDLANARGVQLAIIDLSCYGGASQTLANDKTCVISGSGPNQISWTSFTNQFTSQMSSSANLEEAFVRTLEYYEQPSTPEINSPAGRTAARELRAFEAISGFAKDFYVAMKGACEAPPSTQAAVLMRQMNETIDRFAQSCAGTGDPICTELELLRRKSRDYVNFMRLLSEMTDDMNKNEELGMIEETLHLTNWHTLARDQDEAERKIRADLASAKTEQQRTYLQDQLRWIPRQRELRARLLQNNQRFRSFVQMFKEIGQPNHLGHGAEVHRHIRKIHRELYRRYSSSAKGANPCRDFSL